MTLIRGGVGRYWMGQIAQDLHPLVTHLFIIDSVVFVKNKYFSETEPSSLVYSQRWVKL